MGYLFLSSLFINIAQNDDVLEIFYDVLALEFVENIDDTTYALGDFPSGLKAALMTLKEIPTLLDLFSASTSQIQRREVSLERKCSLQPIGRIL